MKAYGVAWISMMALFLGACADDNLYGRQPYNQYALQDAGGPIVAISGTIRFNNFEGGHYVIVADNGQTFIPLQLDPSYQRDGIRIAVQGHVAQNSYSYYQSGTLLSVTAINPL